MASENMLADPVYTQARSLKKKFSPLLREHRRDKVHQALNEKVVHLKCHLIFNSSESEVVCGVLS